MPFGPFRPRRFTLVALAVVSLASGALWAGGKKEGERCALTKDCADGLICAESIRGETPKRRQQCAKPCANDTECRTGEGCRLARDLTALGDTQRSVCFLK